MLLVVPGRSAVSARVKAVVKSGRRCGLHVQGEVEIDYLLLLALLGVEDLICWVVRAATVEACGVQRVSEAFRARSFQLLQTLRETFNLALIAELGLPDHILVDFKEVNDSLGLIDG